MDGRWPARPWTDERLATFLRERLLAGVHTGHVEAGTRLPSYREVAAETGGGDLRAVARAYAVLEREGLVEVRGRAGVFAAPQERIGGRVLAETASWAARVVREAWSRRIPAAELPEFLRACVAARPVRCALVESTVDQTSSLCAELRDDFGFDAAPVHTDRFAPVEVDGRETERIPRELLEADLIATTAFHSARMAPVAERAGKPLVILRLNRGFTHAVRKELEHGELVVLAVDPAFVDRIRLVAGPEHAAQVRGVLASNRRAVAALGQARPVLVTQAARLALPGVRLPPSFPAEPMISPGSADDLAQALVRLNLEAAAAGPPA